MGPHRPVRRPRRPKARGGGRGRGSRGRGVPLALPRPCRRARRRRARRGGGRARAHRVSARPRTGLRPPPLRDEHGRPGSRGAARPPAGARGCDGDEGALLRAGMGRRRGRAGRRAPRGGGRRALAALPHLATQVPPVPAQRAGGTGADREDGLGRIGLVTPLRRAARRAAGSDRGRGRLHRNGHGPPVLGRPRDASGRRRGDHRGAATGSAHEDLRVQHHPPRQVHRRPAARLPHLDQRAEPRQRDDRRSSAGARRRRGLPLRGGAPLLPAQGPSPRPRPSRALGPVRTADGRHSPRVRGTRRGASSSTHTPTSPTRPARSWTDSSAARGSMHRSGRTSGRARSARPPFLASTRTC